MEREKKEYRVFCVGCGVVDTIKDYSQPEDSLCGDCLEKQEDDGIYRGYQSDRDSMR